MMVKINKIKCIGCGTCVGLCPDCFELGDDQKGKVINQNCKTCELKDIAISCPVDAIEIEG